MCCQARWKREVVQDHKFDFVNTREFHSDSWFTRIRYLWIYVLLLKSFAVYGLDIFTAVTMLTTDHWTNTIQEKCVNSCVINIPFNTAKWVFVGCIIFSFLLLGYETWKARQVILSRDISYAYTNVLANDYYSLKSYDNFCFFCQLSSSTKKKDDFAFFVFFTFKDWKRVILADGPRQSINALILYSFAKANGFQTSNLPAYWDNSVSVLLLLLAMIATVLIFAGSLVLLIAAGVLYVPLLCYIQGNLKEYCCHKIDKRISELIRKKQRQRVAENLAMEKRLAQGDKVKDKNGKVVAGVPQPTLPSVAFDGDDEDMLLRTGAESFRSAPTRSKSDMSLGSASSEWHGEKHGYEYAQAIEHGAYPAMPSLGYNAVPDYPTYPPAMGSYPSMDSLPENAMYSGGYNSSTTRLTGAAAPPGRSTPLQPHPSYGASLHSANSAYSGQSPSTRNAAPVAYQLFDGQPGRPPSAGSSRTTTASVPRSAHPDNSQSGASSAYGISPTAGYAPQRQFSHEETPGHAPQRQFSYDEPHAPSPTATYGLPAGNNQPRTMPPIRAPSVSNYRPDPTALYGLPAGEEQVRSMPPIRAPSVSNYRPARTQY